MDLKIPEDTSTPTVRPRALLVRARGIDTPVWVASMAELRKYELDHPNAYDIVSHVFNDRVEARVFLIPADSILVES